MSNSVLSSSKKRQGISEESLVKGHNGSEKARNLLFWERMRDLRLFNLKRRRLKEDLNDTYK